MAAKWDASPMNRIRLTCRLIRLDRYIVWPTLTVRVRYNRGLESAVIETFDVTGVVGDYMPMQQCAADPNCGTA